MDMRILVVILAICAILACEKDESKEYVIRVDKVDAPAEVGVADTLRIDLLGVVGTSTCYSLRRVETTRSGNHLDVKAVGFHHNPAGFHACGAQMIYLEERVVAVPPHDPGVFTIVVYQPDGEPLVVPVEVK
jgi:hypothetical protein